MFIILIITLIILLYIKLSKTYSYWTIRGVKQRKQMYVLGDNGRVILRKESFFDMVTKVYNSFPNERYAGMYQGLLPTLMIRDPQLIKMITVKDFDRFTDHQNINPDGADPIWTKNLVMLKGDEWKQMRATLSPSFTLSKMKMMFSLISETAEIYVDYFKKIKGSLESIELKDLFTRYTNDVIATVAFGIKCDSINDKTNEFYLMGKETTTFSLRRNLTLFAFILSPKIANLFGLKIFSEKTTNFFKNIVSKNIKAREEQGIVRPDMIHLLMDARKNGFSLTDEEITSQAVIFFFGGFETVSTLLSFMGYELAINPDIQEKLQKEIDDCIRECEGGKVTYEALMGMKYLDMVVSETLRKWPPIATDRICTKSYRIKPKFNEKEILLQPKDVVWIPIGAIHRDRKYYPNPEKFDPERFRNEDTIMPYTYLPFGVGPRSCIGSRLAIMETKIIFVYMLQHFNFVPNEKTEIPLKISKTSFGFLGENGMWVDVKPR